MSILVKFVVSMGVVCGFSYLVADLFIHDTGTAALFGIAAGIFAPVVYTVLDDLWH